MPLKFSDVGFSLAETLRERKLNRNLHRQKLWLRNKICQAISLSTLP